MAETATTEAAPRMKFSHLGLVVSDLETMQDFYTKVLGFELTDKGTALEFFADTPWYINQPFLEPMDFSQSDEDLYNQTEALCQAAPGFRPYAELNTELARRVPASLSD